MALQNKHLELAIQKLDPKNLDAGLPGREAHCSQLYNFLFQRLKIRKTAQDKRAKIASGQVVNIKGTHDNKTMFVCGVPGTGKTAAVMFVIEKLKKLLAQKSCPINDFKSIYVNGQHLASPDKIYCEILYKLTKKSHSSSEKAQELLDVIFKDGEDVVKRTKMTPSKSSSKNFYIVTIDELDILYSERNQNIFYSLFDWPTSSDSRLILIVIANAMDLPERFLRGRIQSRMGWEKLLFESYTSICLQAIISARLGSDLMKKCFDEKAVKLATMRIGRSTGDARRILDICRLALDRAIKSREPKVTTALIDQVGVHSLDRQRLDFVRKCTPIELYLLKCILIETNVVGEENVETMGVYRQLVNILRKDSLYSSFNFVLGHSDYQAILNQLAGVGMIYLENDKPLARKRLFIKESTDVYKDLIRTTEINYD